VPDVGSGEQETLGMSQLVGIDMVGRTPGSGVFLRFIHYSRQHHLYTLINEQAFAEFMVIYMPVLPVTLSNLAGIM
jgi:hypothetical protein